LIWSAPGRWLKTRLKVTIGRMMIAVAALAAFLPAFREDASGSFLAGALIVGTCVVLLAYKMASNSIAWNRSAGLPVTRWTMIWTGLGSLWTALLIIGLADFLFLFLYFMVESFISHPHDIIRYLDPIGIIASAFVTALVVRWLRRTFRREWEAKTRPPPPDGLPDRVDPNKWT
jgi:hypothetical protein